MRQSNKTIGVSYQRKTVTKSYRLWQSRRWRIRICCYAAHNNCFEQKTNKQTQHPTTKCTRQKKLYTLHYIRQEWHLLDRQPPSCRPWNAFSQAKTPTKQSIHWNNIVKHWNDMNRLFSQSCFDSSIRCHSYREICPRKTESHLSNSRSSNSETKPSRNISIVLLCSCLRFTYLQQCISDRRSNATPFHVHLNQKQPSIE